MKMFVKQLLKKILLSDIFIQTCTYRCAHTDMLALWIMQTWKVNESIREILSQCDSQCSVAHFQI